MADLGQSAFEAGKRWVNQAHESGVANARVVRYGFLKWWNNQSPAATRGSKKTQLEKDFRQGYAAGKRTSSNPARGTGTTSYIVYPSQGSPKSFGYLKSARVWAQTKANESGTSSIIYAQGGKGGPWHVTPKKTNPTSRLKSNRLTPVAFTIKGKRHTGKAKLVGTKVKIFVTPNTARKVNPELKEYKVILHSKTAERGVTAVVYATTAGNASREARKRKAEWVTGDPRKWKVFSVKRVTGTR